MIIQSYKKDNIELFVTQDEKERCGAIKLVKGKDPEYQFCLKLDEAADIFDYWLEEIEGKKEEND